MSTPDDRDQQQDVSCQYNAALAQQHLSVLAVSLANDHKAHAQRQARVIGETGPAAASEMLEPAEPDASG